jgi:hypothetical protein
MVKNIFIILVLIFSLNLFAQEISVTASTDTTDYLIGDQIHYTLLINMDNEVFIINPFFRDSLKNIDVIETPDPIVEKNENGKTVKYNYILSRFDSAEVTIPPIKIEYRTKTDSALKFVLSNSVTFKILNRQSVCLTIFF